MKQKLISAVVCALLLAVANASESDAYIESDGTSGIDTGYYLKSSSRVELDFALSEMPQVSDAYKPRVFGADRNHSELQLTGSLFVDHQSYWRIHIGDGTKYKDHYLKKGSFLNTCDTERHIIAIDIPARKFSMNVGTSILTNNFDDSVSIIQGSKCTQTLALFGRQLLNGGFEHTSKTRIYGMKIYENDVLVRHFVPCVKDGIVGFKNVVDGGFICNPAAEGSFAAGGDVLVEESAYVATPEGNNTQAEKHLYVDTGYYATPNTSVELDYALTEQYPKEENPTWCLFYGMSRFCCYVNKNGIGFGVASTWSSKTLAGNISYVSGVRRTAILDQYGRSCAIVTAGYTNEVIAIENTGTYKQDKTIKIATDANAEKNFASIKVYGCRIYESGELVRDFKPYVIGPKQDGSAIVALKDSMTGTLAVYPEATNTKRLSCGSTESISSVPYIENLRANGKYIDTGYLVNKNTKVELDYALLEKRGADEGWYLFWAKDTGIFAAYVNKKGLGFINTKDTWEQGMGMSCGPDSVNVRRTVVLDNFESTASIITDGVTNDVRNMTGPADFAFSRHSLKIGGVVNSASGYSSIRIYGCKIWEKEGERHVLKHNFTPCVKNGSPGLSDSVEGLFITCSGLTYGGAFAPAISPSSAKITVGKSVVLVATAPGAKSYCWFKNGKQIEGGEDGTLEIAWQKGYALDSYQAVSVVEVDGVKAKSEPSKAVAVENLRAGTMVSIR